MEFRVDYIIRPLAATSVALVTTIFATGAMVFGFVAFSTSAGCLLENNESASQFVHDVLESVLIDPVLKFLSKVGDQHLGARPFSGCDLVAKIADVPLYRVANAVGFVAYVRIFLAPAVFLSMQLSFSDQAINIIFRKIGTGRNRDLLLLAGRLVASGNVHNAVGIDVECHFHFWAASRRRR